MDVQHDGRASAPGARAAARVVAVGPAALALDSGADLHPVSIHYERSPDGPGGWRSVITFHDRVDRPAGEGRHRAIRSMTEACARTLGDVVRTHTEDWHMMQAVFLADLAEPAHPAAQSSAPAAPRTSASP